ncbi:hypothetical protein L3Y34_010158 [Caenorhabditis briggsae]|uniref:Uncharacterized protein n=1 Tax=Caenorhabditis briggsae TaxID=6238 RepID=A0AAE9D561_CAEBR|nr:hypothetical protein L3Y34_010158 [Caenorhabditis briggsae]
MYYNNSTFMTYYNAVDNFGSLETKNVFSPLASERMRRRPSQFDRAVHKAYAEPPQLFSGSSILDTIFHRIYWSIRAIQFKIFYKNEDMDLDEVVDKWELGVQPPSLESLTLKTQFSPKWIKYMYARFKNIIYSKTEVKGCHSQPLDRPRHHRIQHRSQRRHKTRTAMESRETRREHQCEPAHFESRWIWCS